MTVSLRRAFLVLLELGQLIVARVNLILGMYCKGAVGKKGDNIWVGNYNLEQANTYTQPK